MAVYNITVGHKTVDVSPNGAELEGRFKDASLHGSFNDASLNDL